MGPSPDLLAGWLLGRFVDALEGHHPRGDQHQQFASLAAGLLLTWARAFGEFGATITFAGNLQGRTQTLPLAVFVALEQDRDTAVAISLVMVAISLGVLVLLRDRWWKTR